LTSQEIYETIIKKRNIKNPAKFINPQLGDLYNPFYMENMEKVVADINTHISFNSNILIFCDYDVDGIFGGFALFHYLSKLTENVNIQISKRQYGYGLTDIEIKNIIKNNYDLVITVDCGISNNNEVDKLKDNGLDVIITDHHESDNPPDCLWINPKVGNYLYRDLSGAGVVFKLICAIANDKMFTEYLDLIAIATIADVVPLKNENRIITKIGLHKSAEQPFKPLKTMMEVLGLEKLNEGNIGYLIAPMINSANRLECSDLPLQILNNINVEENTKKLKEINNKRKIKVKQIYKKLKRKVDKSKNVIVIKDEYPAGITGLIAGRLKEEFHKPAFLVNHNNKGSARTLNPLDCVQTLSKIESYFENFGGHKYAGGYKLKENKFHLFKEFLEDFTEDLKYEKKSADLELKSIEEVTLNVYNKLQLLAPFGAGNPKPLFKLRNIYLSDYKTTKTGEHLQFNINNKDGIWFNYNQDINLQKPLDILFKISYNDYRQDIQLDLKEVEYAKI